MIIKNITLENFRSYYGVNSIDIGEGLTIMIGANGDGKTTIFEALEWLFDTVDALPKLDAKYVSKKKSSELETNEFATTSVSMTYLVDGNERVVRKSFVFTNNLSGELSISNYKHELFIQKGVEKDIKEGDQARRYFDIDFASSVRKYSLFKGEQELNIFNKPEAMSYLVETFSQIRDFDSYINLLKESKKWSELATDNAMKADRKNSESATRLRNCISNEERELDRLEEKKQQKESEAQNFKSLLEELEKNKEASELLVTTNQRLVTLNTQKSDLQNHLKENYTFRLLDEMWILLGFEPIAEEYRELIGSLDKEQRLQQSAYDQEIGAKKMVAQIQKELNDGKVPLAINVPDENTMREMLRDEHCKVCNRPAPKGSPAYNFMKHRLDEYLQSINISDEKEQENQLFQYEFIKELTNHYAILHQNKAFIHNVNQFIDNSIKSNVELHSKIDSLNEKIQETEDQKKKILAQSDGLTEEQLTSAYHNISKWWESRADAEQESQRLQIQIQAHSDKLMKYRNEYSKISEESSAAMYNRSSVAIRTILNAFINAKVNNKRAFLNRLEQESNKYLEMLNKGDFRGYAQIQECANNGAEILLVDTDGSKIFNPNTALKTTMYMSLLFAISQLTSLKHEDDYPLIFDAPTSSFTAAKESDFFSVIGNINKQTIIFTKSFLIEDKFGNSTLDEDRLKTIKGKKYRIKKKLPFDEKNLSTIQTMVEHL